MCRDRVVEDLSSVYLILTLMIVEGELSHTLLDTSLIAQVGIDGREAITV